MKLTSDEIKSICLSIDGLTQPDELAMLYQLCWQTPGYGWFVELGSYLGRSSAALCQAGIELDCEVMCIDNFTPIAKRGWDDIHGTAELLRCNLEAFGYCPVIIDGDSRDVPEVLRRGASVALLFIDSNHEPLHFEQEWNAWKGCLLPGAIIACHDYANPNCAGLGPMIDKLLGQLPKVAQVGTTGAWKWED